MKILLVRLRQIGDVVFTTPVVAALRRHFPGAQITYVVEPAAAAVVAANPHLDRVIIAPRARGLAGGIADLALARRLRLARYDVAIDFHGGPRASLLTWLSRATVRIGYDVPGRGWMYTRRVHRPRVLRARHSVDNQWDLIESLGIARSDAEQSPVEMVVEAPAAARVADRLSRHAVGPTDRLVVLHVSAGNPFRRWPIDSFADVGATLASSADDIRIIVTSGPSDREAAARVVATAQQRLSLNTRARVVACGEFSIDELRALVDRAALFIGGDSGPMHVASASHVPIVALYGPTLPARSGPWRSSAWATQAVEVTGLPCRPCDQRVCTPGDFRCLTWIQPHDVVGAAGRLLATPLPAAATNPEARS